MDFIILYIRYNNNYYKRPGVSIKKRAVTLFKKYQLIINN